jgi:DNA-binding NtrC family response regulator
MRPRVPWPFVPFYPPNYAARGWVTIIDDLEGEDLPSRVDRMVARFEAEQILHALEAMGGNPTRAASQLGISLRTLINKLDKYGIVRKGYAREPGPRRPAR